MIQKIKGLHLLIYFLFAPALFSQADKIKVIAEEAFIFAHASENSTRIDTVKKGAILTLFNPGKREETWYYVHYRSENWGAQISGFVHASKVELMTAGQREEPAQVEEKIKEEISTTRTEETPKETQIPRNRIFAIPSTAETELLSQNFKPAGAKSLDVPLLPEREESIPSIEKPKISTAKISVPKMETKTEKSLGEAPVPPGRTLTLPEISGMESQSQMFPKAPEKPPAPVVKPERQEQIPTIKTPKISTVRVPPPQQEIRIEKSWGEALAPPGRILVFPQLAGAEPRSQVFQAAPEIKPAPPPPKPVIKKKPPPPPEKIEKLPIQKPKPQIQSPPQLLKPKIPEKKFHLLTLSLGYGPSTGGIGGSLQVNTKSGLSFHAGAGYYPAKLIFSGHDWVKNKVFFSGGIKYYLPVNFQRLRPYLDLQYGGIRVEAVQMFLGIWNYEFLIENHQKALWGPSLSAGAEFKIGMLGINAAVGLAYNTTSWELWEQNLLVTSDVSLLLYF